MTKPCVQMILIRQVSHVRFLSRHTVPCLLTLVSCGALDDQPDGFGLGEHDPMDLDMKHVVACLLCTSRRPFVGARHWVMVVSYYSGFGDLLEGDTNLVVNCTVK